MKRIVIDPGHGGWDHGSTAVDGVYEAVFNWDLSKALGDYLSANFDAEILYTHQGAHTALDATENLARELAGRSHVANSAKADLLVSIHHDATGNPEVRGASLWIWTSKLNPQSELTWLPATENHTDPKTYPIAKRIVKPLREALERLGVPWRGWDDPDGIACANFGILRNTEGPAFLVECFHGSSAEDVAAARHGEFIPSLAITLGEAIADAINLDQKVTLPPANGVVVLVDGRVVECKARIEEGRTVALVAPILGALGATWAWSGEKRMLSIRSPKASP